jgi:drug/metabolite transporter (DMT)-like permease
VTIHLGAFVAQQWYSVHGVQQIGRQDSKESANLASVATGSPQAVDVRPFLWMSISAVLFAVMNAAVRAASETTPTPVIATVRTFCGFLLAWGYARSQGVTLPRTFSRFMWLRSLFGTMAMTATFYTLSRSDLPLGDAATLFNLSPIGVALLSPLLLREPLSKTIGMSLLLSLTGVVLILRPTFLFGAVNSYAVDAVLLAILAAVLSSFAMVMLRRAGTQESTHSIAAHFSMVATMFFAALTLATVPLTKLMHIPARSIGWMLVAGVSAGIAQLTMTRAYAQDKAARVSAFGYLNVVASAALGALLSQTLPSPASLLGMAAVIAGGLILVFGPVQLR